MGYTVSFARRAQSALDRISPQSAQRIYAAIAALADDPRPHGCKKLVDRPGWRIRVGNYRVIYGINDDELTVLVVAVAPRSEAYW